MAVANQQWVVQIQASVQAMAPRTGASIYRVPEWIKRLSRNDAYGPRVVSLGPFHHGNPNLQHMEEHKTQAMQRLVHRSGKPFQRFFDAINGWRSSWRRPTTACNTNGLDAGTSS
ncbi:hypothetical protein PVAP13_8NG189101 [Panicum virgatum]|uniref:Uncharacterized protein n=1 Tax=Panicum virgatum TaxID=38727 RepID=A0A8T0P3S6_PANVG|nr:hypothetical protein PVAP13_8NG189101 [Panicum virgatum]